MVVEIVPVNPNVAPVGAAVSTVVLPSSVVTNGAICDGENPLVQSAS